MGDQKPPPLTMRDIDQAQRDAAERSEESRLVRAGSAIAIGIFLGIVPFALQPLSRSLWVNVAASVALVVAGAALVAVGGVLLASKRR